MHLNSLNFSDSCPYPPVKVQCENPRYAAAMLSNIGSCNSEMSAVSLYFYNSLITKECFEEFSHCFHQISIVEMHHLELFGQFALALGTDPRLWCMEGDQTKYWSPSCNQYPENITALIKNSITAEKDAIKKYKEQCNWIEDPCIRALLCRIIKDEEIHVRIFCAMLEEL